MINPGRIMPYVVNEVKRFSFVLLSTKRLSVADPDDFVRILTKNLIF